MPTNKSVFIKSKIQSFIKKIKSFWAKIKHNNKAKLFLGVFLGFGFLVFTIALISNYPSIFRTSYSATCTWTGAVDNLWSESGNWSGCSGPVDGDDIVFPAGAPNMDAMQLNNGITQIGNLTIEDYVVFNSFSNLEILGDVVIDAEWVYYGNYSVLTINQNVYNNSYWSIYDTYTTIESSAVVNNNYWYLDGGELNIYGEINNNSYWYIYDTYTTIESSAVVNNNSNWYLYNGELRIYGEVNNNGYWYLYYGQLRIYGEINNNSYWSIYDTYTTIESSAVVNNNSNWYLYYGELRIYGEVNNNGYFSATGLNLINIFGVEQNLNYIQSYSSELQIGADRINLIIDSLSQYGNFSVEQSAPDLGSSTELYINGSHNYSLGETFTIIDNQTSDPIIGEFSNLAEGDTITHNNGVLEITYFGGDGNDVVLTVQSLHSNSIEITAFDLTEILCTSGSGYIGYSVNCSVNFPAGFVGNIEFTSSLGSCTTPPIIDTDTQASCNFTTNSVGFSSVVANASGGGTYQSDTSYINVYPIPQIVNVVPNTGLVTGGESVDVFFKDDLDTSLTFAGERVSYVATDSAGDTVTIGNFDFYIKDGSDYLYGYGGDDIILSKRGAGGGGIIWQQVIGGNAHDVGYGVAIDSSSNIYITGSFSGTANFGPFSLSSSAWYDGFVAKLDSSGNWLWVEQITGNRSLFSKGIDVDNSGNVYISGHYTGEASFGSINLSDVGPSNFFIAKLDTDGNWIWASQNSNSTFVYNNSGLIKVDSDNDVVYSNGHFSVSLTLGAHTIISSNITNSSSGTYDVFVTQVNASTGDFNWLAGGGGDSLLIQNEDTAGELVIDTNGDVYITGSISTGDAIFGSITIPRSVSYSEQFVAKINSLGSWQWVNLIGGEAGYNRHGGLTIDSNDNIYTLSFLSNGASYTYGSTTLVGTGFINTVIASLDVNGNFNWAKKTGGNNVSARSISTNQFDEVVIVGVSIGGVVLDSLSFTTSGIGTWIANLDVTTQNWNWLEIQKRLVPFFTDNSLTGVELSLNNVNGVNIIYDAFSANLISPAGPVGFVDVKGVNNLGFSTTLSDGYEYLAYSAGCQASGLCLFYDFNNDASYNGVGQIITDISGSGYNGTLGLTDLAETDDPEFVSVGGVEALKFDNSDNLNKIVKTSLSMYETTNPSIEIWFKRLNNNNTSNPVGERLVNIYSSMRNLGVGIENKTIHSIFGDNQDVANTGFIPNTEWQSVVLTFNNTTNETKMFVNGVEHSSLIAEQNHDVLNSFYTIGAETDFGISKQFNGYIGLVRIYNRVLNQSEVTDNFNEFKDRFGFNQANVNVKDVPTLIDYGSYTLSNQNQIVCKDITNNGDTDGIEFVDRRANFASWNATISATNLTDGTRTIDVSQLNLNPGNFEVDTGSGIFTTPGPNDVFVDESTQLTLVINSQNNGGGRFTQIPEVCIDVPAFQPVGNYTGTLTITILP